MDQRAHWQSTGKLGVDASKLFKVRPDTDEYKTVGSAFASTMPNAVVDTIERVENGPQHELFTVHKKNVTKSIAGGEAMGGVTRMLYHGTSAIAQASIIHGSESGFNSNLSGTRVGNIYGMGTYFARDAAYSDPYACMLGTGQRQMLAVEVVVGRWTRGTADMRIFPNLPGETYKRFNSLVDNEENPSIFVVQTPSQSYPAYLITYH